MTDYPRICKQCLLVVPARPLKKPRDMTEEEFGYQKIIDESRNCTNCNGHLTKHIKKVVNRLDELPNNVEQRSKDEVLKLFGVTDPKAVTVLKSKQAEESKLQAELKGIDLRLASKPTEEVRKELLERREVIVKALTPKS